MSEITITQTPKALRFHRSTCKKINPANVIEDTGALFASNLEPATCCKPTPAMLAAAKLATAPVVLTEPEAPKATRVRSTGPAVTFSINGKPRIVRTSPRPYTFSYLAGEVLGGKGASARLREILAAQGIADPDHSEWEAEVEGKKIGAKLAVAS